MPEINQYTVGAKELVELIIKASDVHEGRWSLMANFGMAVGNFGPTTDQVFPGVVATVQSVGIQRDLPDTPMPPSLTVDAAEVNPRKSGTKSPRKG